MINIPRTASLALCAATFATAQVTKTDVFKPTTPKDDAKANSPEVPDVYAISGDIKRVPRRSPQNRPYMVTSKPAIGAAVGLP